jgi:hypothetical protein
MTKGTDEILRLNNNTDDSVHQIATLASLCMLTVVIEEIFLVSEVSSLAVGPNQPVFSGY